MSDKNKQDPHEGRDVHSGKCAPKGWVKPTGR